MLVSLNNVNKVYNGNVILQGINLTIDENDRIGLVGVNGCGKSTLIKIITGSEIPDRLEDNSDYSVSFASKTSFGYLQQMGGLDKDSTVIEEMQSVFSKVNEAYKRMSEIEKLMSKVSDEESLKALSDEYNEKSAYFDAHDGYMTDVKINTVLNGMGFEKSDYGRTISGFSGGEKTRLAICKLLLESPNLLILDEPTNHLDFKTIMWLEDYLKDYKGALLIVSHDRYFLDRVCKSICEIENHRLTRYKGNYTTFTKLKEEASARQLKEYEMQQKKIADLQEYVDKNLVRASTSKSAKSRIKTLEKMDIIEKPLAFQKTARLSFEYNIQPPFDILSVKNTDICVGSGESRKTLAEDVSFEIKRGTKLAVIGDNGCGKSTLLKILLGRLPHFKGRISWASNVKFSYFEQESTNLNPLNTVIDEIHNRYPSMTDLEIRSLLGQVRLVGENVFKEIGVISGGERAKVCFALMMLERGNVLILDEPTNHLDLATKEVLENALADFDGTIIFVSHDRYLINKIADKILEITDGCTEFFDCGFEKYCDIKKKREAQAKLEADAEKALRLQEIAAEKGAKAYKNKKQRSEDAKRRNLIRSLEKELDEIQLSIDNLNEEITKEEVFSDYVLMNEKCAEIENLKNLYEEKFEELMLLSE